MWNYEKMWITGYYMDKPVSGIVESSRVAYGGEVKHTVVLDNPINMYGVNRDRVILNHSEIETVADNKE